MSSEGPSRGEKGPDDDDVDVRPPPIASQLSAVLGPDASQRWPGLRGVPSRLAHVFEAFDADEEGQLSVEAMLAVAQCVKPGSKASADAVLSLMDINQDRAVDADDFTAFFLVQLKDWRADKRDQLLRRLESGASLQPHVSQELRAALLAAHEPTKRTVWNGASTKHGLVVSALYRRDRHGNAGEFVDVYDGCRLREEMPVHALSSVRLSDADCLMKKQAQIRGARMRDTMEKAIELLGERPMLGLERSGEAGTWDWLSWKQVGEEARQLACELRGRLTAHSCVGICALNCKEWVVCFMGCVLAGLVVVPVHASSCAEYIEHIVHEAALKLVFVDEATLPKLIATGRRVVPADSVCQMRPPPNEAQAAAQEHCESLPALVERGAARMRQQQAEAAAQLQLLRSVRELARLQRGTDVEVLTKQGWALATMESEESEEPLHVAIRSRSVCVSACEVRPCAPKRRQIFELLCHTPLCLGEEVCTRAAALAAVEEEEAQRAAWATVLRRAGASEPVGPFVMGLVRLWALERCSALQQLWGSLGEEASAGSWATAVLSWIATEFEGAGSASASCHDWDVEGVLLRALAELECLERVDAHTAWLANSVALRAYSGGSEVQARWFRAAEDISAQGVVQGEVYRCLGAIELRASERAGSQVMARLPQGSLVQVQRVAKGTSALVHAEAHVGWLDLFEDAEGQRACLGHVEGDDADATLLVMYTSGSTGAPKGALISDDNFHDDVRCKPSSDLLAEDLDSSVRLVLGPLSTSGSLRGLWRGVLDGGRLALLPDLSRAYDVLASVGPTSFSAVPQWWSLFWKRYQRREAQCATEAQRSAVREEAAAALGHRLTRINCGGAMPNPACMQWLKQVVPHVRVTENYACTEAGGITRSGPDGEPVIVEGIDVKLVDSPPFLSSDVPPRGEVWVRTRRMASGYLNRPDLTSAAFDEEGYFCTGDVGELDAERKQLRLLDRRSATFKLSNGEWVAPESLEAVFSGTVECQQVFVHGDSAHPAVVAIVVSEEAQEAQVLAAISAASGELRHFQVPRAVHVTREPWSVHNGLLTGAGKLSRHALRERFRAELQGLLQRQQQEDEAACSDEVQAVVRLVQQGTDAEAWEAIPWNSAFLVQVAAALRDAFGVQVPVAVLLGHPTLHDVVAFLRGERPLELMRPVDFDAETSLNDDIHFDGAVACERAPGQEEEEEVLLTGATGHVGAAVLHALLVSRPARRVCCLVRASSDEAALERVLACLRLRGYDDAVVRLASESGALRALAGDLGAPMLGLSEPLFSALAHRTAVILNVGCHVHHLHGYHTLRAANVGAVLTLLRLASIGASKRFVQVSTVSARRRGPGYAQSKWVADRLVEAAIGRGLDGAVLPLAMVGPDRRTGAANAEDWVMRFICGTAELGVFYAPSDTVLSLMPVDECASALVSLATPGSGDARAAIARLGRTASHNSCATLMSRVAAAPTVRGRRMHAVSRTVWQEQLRTLPGDNAMAPLIARYQEGLPGSSLPRPADGAAQAEGQAGKAAEAEGQASVDGYSQVEIDRCLEFLAQAGHLKTVCNVPLLVRTRSHGGGSFNRSTAGGGEVVR